MCIFDDTLGAFPQFNSLCKCEQLMWIYVHILQILILTSPWLKDMHSYLIHHEAFCVSQTLQDIPNFFPVIYAYNSYAKILDYKYLVRVFLTWAYFKLLTAEAYGTYSIQLINFLSVHGCSIISQSYHPWLSRQARFGVHTYYISQYLFYVCLLQQFWCPSISQWASQDILIKGIKSLLASRISSY
jgi:hypothetical protein